MATALRDSDRRAAALVGGVGDDLDLGVVELLDQAVFAGGAHVVAGPGQRGRGPHQPTGRVSENLHIHSVALVFPGEERPVIARSHADPVDRQQRAVEDHERLTPGHVERLVQARCDRGEDVDALADVAEHRRGANPEPAGQRGVGLALVQVRQHQQRLLSGRESAPPAAEVLAVPA
ncbi:hypothetical protein AFB00_30380 (plasmid) [Pseudonocardia sp. HH130630-07]|nr:hypothetical protein XF36_28535 [Pseudonocardia sp. HH130629-09]ANY10714.1 hypothetical protein AFB00_30380 [Pseudonocardia sp. HH130630-07]